MGHDQLDHDDGGTADKDMTVVPLPGAESEAEHARIRASNDRDQALERDGKSSRHNRGYDEAVRGSSTPEPEVDRVVDE
jgi:hypothetical protein